MASLIGGPEVFGIAACLQDVEFDGMGALADIFADLVTFLLRFLSILPFLTDHISQMERAKADTFLVYASRKAMAHQKSKEVHQYLYSVNP